MYAKLQYFRSIKYPRQRNTDVKTNYYLLAFFTGPPLTPNFQLSFYFIFSYILYFCEHARLKNATATTVPSIVQHVYPLFFLLLTRYNEMYYELTMTKKGQYRWNEQQKPFLYRFSLYLVSFLCLTSPELSIQR